MKPFSRGLEGGGGGNCVYFFAKELWEPVKYAQKVVLSQVDLSKIEDLKTGRPQLPCMDDAHLLPPGTL